MEEHPAREYRTRMYIGRWRSGAVRSPIALQFQDCVGIPINLIWHIHLRSQSKLQSPMYSSHNGRREVTSNNKQGCTDHTNLSSWPVQFIPLQYQWTLGAFPIPVSIPQELKIGLQHSQSTILMQSWRNHKIRVQLKNIRPENIELGRRPGPYVLPLQRCSRIALGLKEPEEGMPSRINNPTTFSVQS